MFLISGNVIIASDNIYCTLVLLIMSILVWHNNKYCYLFYYCNNSDPMFSSATFMGIRRLVADDFARKHKKRASGIKTIISLLHESCYHTIYKFKIIIRM